MDLSSFVFDFSSKLQMSKKKDNDFLSKLPPEILIKIFSMGDLELPNLAISHTLYPYATMNLFRDVHIYTLAALYKFQEIMKEKVWLRSKVLSLVISYERILITDGSSDDDESDEEDWSDVDTDELEGGAGNNLDKGNYKEILTALNPKRLVTMFTSLTNLRRYGSFGKKLAVPMFDEYYEVDGPSFNSILISVTFYIRPDEDIVVEDQNYLLNISKLTSLEELVLNLNYNTIPYPSDEPLIESKSWNLETLVLQDVDLDGTHLKNLIPAFKGLKHLKIECDDAGGDISQALELLPSTMESLKICLPHANTSAPNPPNFDNVFKADNFPNLRVIHLMGRIFTPAIFPNLSTLDHVTCLHFRSPSPLYGHEILSLMKKGPSKMKSLGHLELDMNFDPLRAGGRSRPRWTDDFSKKDARKILEIAQGKRMRIDGSILCALKLCQTGCESCGGT